MLSYNPLNSHVKVITVVRITFPEACRPQQGVKAESTTSSDCQPPNHVTAPKNISSTVLQVERDTQIQTPIGGRCWKHECPESG